MAEEGLTRAKERKCKAERLKKAMRDRAGDIMAQFLGMAGVRAIGTLVSGREAITESVPMVTDDYAEDAGTRRALGVTRSWRRSDLLATFSL
jgi:hypothetical protein